MRLRDDGAGNSTCVVGLLLELFIEALDRLPP
jgi:hypothetical protein